MKADDQTFAPVEPGDQRPKRPESKQKSFFSRVLREQPGESLDEPNEVQVFEIEKSKIDEREYRGVILPNGLRVMLVSDPSIHLSAVSLDVACGSYSNPPELPGLAHYVEHLLFLGTEKVNSVRKIQLILLNPITCHLTNSSRYPASIQMQTTTSISSGSTADTKMRKPI